MTKAKDDILVRIANALPPYDTCPTADGWFSLDPTRGYWPRARCQIGVEGLRRMFRYTQDQITKATTEVQS